MVLQQMIIPDRDTELYFSGGAVCSGAISLKSGETVSFGTYYNSFCYSKYLQYTVADRVSFTAEASGSVSARLMCFDGTEHSCIAKSSGCTVSAELAQLPQAGYIYAEVTAHDDCLIRSAAYSADCTPRDISVCIAVCTFRREEYVLRNIERLRAFDFTCIDRVFFSDNGNTLDREGLSDGFITVLQNKNYGGSGGFTRGLIEAKEGGFTHVILMDDDVEFHPETLEQMTVFVSLLKEDYRNSWFSAAMIPLDAPWRQFELGAEWNGKEAEVHKHDLDIRSPQALFDNLTNPDVQYGGWWTLLMPLSVTDNGLPYPFFIKFDDVEYGMRKPRGTEIITMNGIAVRHEAFDRKKSFVLDYYNLRNELIVNALYGKCGAFGAARRLMYELMKHLCLYRYDNIPLVLRAARDFLRGVDFFLETDEEQLNSALIAAAPKLLSLTQLGGWQEDMRCDEHILDKRISLPMILTLGGHLIPSFALKKQPSAVPLSRTGAVDCFGKASVIQYQPGGDNGFASKRSFA